MADQEAQKDQAEDVFEALKKLFADSESKFDREQDVLTQNLEGFASCFPDWDLHPPARKT